MINHRSYHETLPIGVIIDEDDNDNDDHDRDTANEVRTRFVPPQNFNSITIFVHNSSLLIILNTKKRHQIWHTLLYIGVVGINRREHQRNHIKMQFGL